MNPVQPELRVPDEPHCDPNDGCITCGDVAEEMRVMRIDHDRELALCADEAGGHHTVEIALVQPIAESDTLLVHAGTAIANLAPEEAPRTPGRGSTTNPGIPNPGTPGRGSRSISPRRSRGQEVLARAEEVAG